jgi:branched-subunit amino acid aminotransferase/4-amino-4-deoxychorismate lyase
MSEIVVLKSGSNAHLNPLHSGFAHGWGIFETIRFARGQLEFWNAHYERLLHSAKVFNLHFDPAESAVLAAIRELVQSEKLRDVAVKLSLLEAGTDSCCYIYSRSIALPGDDVSLYLSMEYPLNECSVLAGHKTHNYIESVHLKRSVSRAGFYEGVRVNTAGFLTEAAMANLFFIKGNTLYTPALSTGILPGVIRAEVLEAARIRSISFEEGCYPVESLKTATAVFLTNSSIGILPVSSLQADDFAVTYAASHPIVDALKIALDDAKKRKSIRLIHE